MNFNERSKTKKNIIIYGAGVAGRDLSYSLLSSEEYQHIAYIDDDEDKQGNYINNIPIYSFEKISKIFESFDGS